MIFQITIRFLDTHYHGRRDGGEPEWPPSPLRVFQAMLAGAKADWSVERAAAFDWLEQLQPPVIHAPRVRHAVGVLTYVPNNNADSGEIIRAPKTIQPCALPDKGRHVEYLWTFDERSAKASEVL